MAIVKHIKSRNANYSAAIDYLLLEHDEKTEKKIVDESGNIHTHIVINMIISLLITLPIVTSNAESSMFAGSRSTFS